MRGRGKRNHSPENAQDGVRSYSCSCCRRRRFSAPPLSAGRKRTREVETTRKQTAAPTSPPTTSLAARASHNALRRTGASPSAPPPAGPASRARNRKIRENGLLSSERPYLHPSSLLPSAPFLKRGERWKALTSFVLFFFFKARLHSPAKTAHLSNYSYLKCPRYFFVQSIFYRFGQLLMKFNPSYQDFPPHSYKIFLLLDTHPCNTKFATNLLWH